jgi:hypothetical protein
VNRTPFSQPVVFTNQVLLDPGSHKDFYILIVPGQEHFLQLAAPISSHDGVNSQG